jgi:hypothetical protein
MVSGTHEALPCLSNEMPTFLCATDGHKLFLNMSYVSQALPHLSFPTTDARDKKLKRRPVLSAAEKPTQIDIPAPHPGDKTFHWRVVRSA